jgi:hypothetical protein
MSCSTALTSGASEKEADAKYADHYSCFTYIAHEFRRLRLRNVYTLSSERRMSGSRNFVSHLQLVLASKSQVWTMNTTGTMVEQAPKGPTDDVAWAINNLKHVVP